MNRIISDRLCLSSIGDDCNTLAAKYGLGVEIAEFCYALNLDCGYETHLEASRRLLDKTNTRAAWFHAPFADIAACAIDPKVRKITELRYEQSIKTAEKLKINKIVIHGGYIPYVYYEESYVEQSILFFRDFMKKVPENMLIALENVMEPSPDMLVKIVEGVKDARLGLCLDIGHANTEISHVSPAEWVLPMAPYLKHVHLHNNYGGRDLHNSLDDGNVPIIDLLPKITALCPAASFTLEVMHCESSVKWLMANGFIG